MMPEPIPDPPPPQYPSLGDFVVRFVCQVYRRQVTDTDQATWCPRWHQHPEALHRLYGLWQAFEVMPDASPLGLTAWWREADYTMRALTSPDGPFKHCSVRKGHSELLAPLPTDMDGAPVDLFSYPLRHPTAAAAA